MQRPWSIYVGFDPREAAAFAVARHSIQRFNRMIPIHGIVLSEMVKKGLYTRETIYRSHWENGNKWNYWDVVSKAPMSTEFAISRFLVPHLAGRGLALFMDCDVLVKENVARLFEIAEDGTKAVWCVKHQHIPEVTTKMDGQTQAAYPRKNWSSVMMFDCDHEANQALTVKMVNSLPGRELHRFCWLKDEEIGELDPEWNYLVEETKTNLPPKIVHFTAGGPWFPDYECVEYGDEWRAALAQWAS